MSFSIAIKPNGAFGKQRPDCGSEILMRVLVVRNIYKTNANLSLLLFSAKPERRIMRQFGVAGVNGSLAIFIDVGARPNGVG